MRYNLNNHNNEIKTKWRKWLAVIQVSQKELSKFKVSMVWKSKVIPSCKTELHLIAQNRYFAFWMNIFGEKVFSLDYRKRCGSGMIGLPIRLISTLMTYFYGDASKTDFTRTTQRLWSSWNSRLNVKYSTLQNNFSPAWCRIFVWRCKKSSKWRDSTSNTLSCKWLAILIWMTFVRFLHSQQFWRNEGWYVFFGLTVHGQWDAFRTVHEINPVLYVTCFYI